MGRSVEPTRRRTRRIVAVAVPYAGAVFHLRVVAPADVAPGVVEYLVANRGTTNVVHLPGAAHQPVGDVVLCDLAREGANDVISELRARDLHRLGSISLHEVVFSIADGVAQAEEFTPGLGTDAVVWEQLEARLRNDGRMSWSFAAFVVLAVLIASLGILLDSPILIVGAMVVGPEYGPLAALSFWIHRNRPARAARALRTLVVGLGIGVAVACLAGFVARVTDLSPDQVNAATLPQTGFVFNPDALSFVVAVLAGAAGMLALSGASSSSLVGVLISVTTIPAAAGIGVALSIGDLADARGALVQLAVNVVGIVIAGVVTLHIQSRAWKRVSSR